MMTESSSKPMKDLFRYPEMLYVAVVFPVRIKVTNDPVITKKLYFPQTNQEVQPQIGGGGENVEKISRKEYCKAIITPKDLY